MHLHAETIHSYIDHELSEAERARAAAHLQNCAECRSRLDGMTARAERVRRQLDVLGPAAPAPQLAFEKFKARRLDASRRKEPLMQTLFTKRYRPAWMALGLIVLLALAFSLEPVQVWAGQLLQMFRVQQIAVLPIDETGLTSLSGNEALVNQVGQMFSKSVTVSKKPGAPVSVTSAAQAGQMAGFKVRLPASRTDTPQLRVQGASAFQFVVDRARAQALLDQTGHSDLKLPASVDGATIKVTIPAGVTAGYGNCPQPETGGRTMGGGSAARRFANCIMLVEIPSPTIDTPPNLNVEQLAVIGLQFTGMTSQQAQEYAQSVDWTSTLVIPIPKNGASYQKVNVDGSQGYLIQRPMDDAPEFALVWVKNGIIYAIGGLGTSSAQAMQMANSMQ